MTRQWHQGFKGSQLENKGGKKKGNKNLNIVYVHYMGMNFFLGRKEQSFLHIVKRISDLKRLRTTALK